ncbi:hypothetical protein FRB99_006413 [Tulasnella sp. 403]|nr:hypothetical protein FRB99_006413 [Tulasnella sp. 403]
MVKSNWKQTPGGSGSWVSRIQFKALASGRLAILPPGATSITVVYLIHTKISFDRHKPLAGGGHGQVFRGVHSDFGIVALKKLTIVDNPEHQKVTLFETEVRTWKVLDHRHILPFLGTFVEKGHLYLVSTWAENGALPEYLESNPEVDKRDYIFQIADAVSYLHAKEYIHGDIKAQNILVARDGRSQLCDFGLSRAVSELTLPPLKRVGSLPFRSPEIWNGERKSLESDVYAFGMTIYQILSGKTPYHDSPSEAAIAGAVLIKNKRPPHDPPFDPRNGMSFELFWEIAERCWKEKPDERPSMADVFGHLCSTRVAP